MLDELGVRGPYVRGEISFPKEHLERFEKAVREAYLKGVEEQKALALEIYETNRALHGSRSSRTDYIEAELRQSDKDPMGWIRESLYNSLEEYGKVPPRKPRAEVFVIPEHQEKTTYPIAGGSITIVRGDHWGPRPFVTIGVSAVTSEGLDARLTRPVIAAALNVIREISEWDKWQGGYLIRCEGERVFESYGRGRPCK